MNEKLRWFYGKGQPINIQLAGITLPDSKYYIHRRLSDITVIEYVCSGEGFIKINGEAVAVTAGQVYLLSADNEHEYYSNPENPWKKIFINVGGSLAAVLPQKFGMRKIGVYNGDGMKDIFDEISEIVFNEPCPNDEEMLLSLFFKAVYRLSQRIKNEAEDKDAENMKRYIDGNKNRIIGNGELAEHIYRSKDFCIKHFAAQYGVTPYEYQLREKMKVACDLLKNTVMPISEIAEAIGYSDPQYFSGLFRKRLKKSPREYRNGVK